MSADNPREETPCTPTTRPNNTALGGVLYEGAMPPENNNRSELQIAIAVMQEQNKNVLVSLAELKTTLTLFAGNSTEDRQSLHMKIASLENQVQLQIAHLKNENDLKIAALQHDFSWFKKIAQTGLIIASGTAVAVFGAWAKAALGL